MIKTSAPRTFSLIFTAVSPSGKTSTCTLARGWPTDCAIFSASARWAVPLMIFIVGGIVDRLPGHGNTLPAVVRIQPISELNEPLPAENRRPVPPKIDPVVVISAVLSLGIVIWFYGFVPRFATDRSMSTFEWLNDAWNGETDYEHGVLFPFVILGLIVYQFKSLRAAAGKGSWVGLVPVLIGALLFAASYRTLQPRIAAGALPFLLWGGCYFLWGWRVARILAFPLFFFWLAVPLPSFQQATTHLQLIATSLAHNGSGLFGVETRVVGTSDPAP